MEITHMSTTPSAPAAAPTSAATPVQANPATSDPATGALGTESPKSPVAQKHKLKVDGQELELPLDEIIQLAQQGKSAGKRFQEAAQARREAEQLVTYLKQNPKEAFKKLGLDVRKFSEDTLLEFIQQEQMSPEQKKAYENEQRLRQYEASEKAAKEKAHADQMAALEAQQMQAYDKMFVEALTASGLPKTAYTVKRMAELTLVNEKKKLGLEPAQLAKIVREDYEAEHRQLYANADGEQLLALLGKEGVKKLSKAQLAKYKAAKTNSAVATKPADKKEPKQSAAESWKAFKARNRSLI